MAEKQYRYVIVGGGLTGASAIKGIREVDKDGEILLIGEESVVPYHRPPLSKSLWKGTKKENDIFIEKENFYKENNVDVVLDTLVTGLDPEKKTISDTNNASYRYEKLLLATGGAPKTLSIPGGDLDSISYFRTLSDFQRIHSQAEKGKTAVVIGGGFIGSEMAAALQTQEMSVTMVFPEEWICGRVFPRDLGIAIGETYQERGIRILSGDVPQSIAETGNRLKVTTKGGEELAADIVVAGLGISPSTELAEQAGLAIEDGIRVNEFLQTSDETIFAAGDNATFPCEKLSKSIRIEHWDNALSQGKHAGRVMAGKHEPFTYLPYFFSDLFEFGYEAVGEVSSKLETVADWDEQFVKGTVYYTENGIVRGVMLCDIWEKTDWARDQIGTNISVAQGAD